MATARDIVEKALRKINVAHVGDAVPSEDAGDALAALNSMMESWPAKGLDYTHTTLELPDTLTTDARYDNAIEWLLADEIASNFQTAARPDKVAEAWSILYAGLRVAPTIKVDSGLTQMPSQYRYGNVRTES